jgi:Alpha/beta hydrolase domain
MRRRATTVHFAVLILVGIGLAWLSTSVSSARVLRIEIEKRVPILEGRAWGTRGGYELIEGRVHFGFDPANEANSRIADLGLAPQSADGLVEASADFAVLQAIDPARRSGTALVDIPNRGRRLALNSLNRVRGDIRSPRDFDPNSDADWGDGFLMESGLTVMWVGWQADAPTFPGSMNVDVPRAREKDGTPVRGLARSDWVVDEDTNALDLPVPGHVPCAAADPTSTLNRLTRRRGREDAREVVPRTAWRFDATRTRIEMTSGFDAGWIYELVYVAESPLLVGLGFAALRDFASYARYEATSPFRFARGIVSGTSQSGRFLRHFLHEGFNQNEQEQPVFDGAFIVIAGAGRGGFNHRFSHPGRVGNPYANFFYPGDDFPFASRSIPFEGKSSGLLENERASKSLPRIMQINTGYEYWGRAASLIHTTPDGLRDVEPLANERLYHIASAPHYPLPFPPGAESEVADGIYRGSAIDMSPILRALLHRLVQWVEDDTPPPASRIPKVADGTLLEAADLEYPIPRLRKPRSPHVAYRMDFGPRFDEGIIDHQPPHRGEAYSIRVPIVDPLGSEATGIRPMEIVAPIGTYTPWALRSGRAFASDEMIGYLGTFIALACDPTEASVDARPSLKELYPDRSRFEARVEEGLDAAVREGWMLKRDREYARRAALGRWDWIARIHCAEAPPFAVSPDSEGDSSNGSNNR